MMRREAGLQPDKITQSKEKYQNNKTQKKNTSSFALQATRTGSRDHTGQKRGI